MLQISPLKGSPPLAWYFAKKTLGNAAFDVCICVEGRKGKGKSILSLYLAQEIAKYLARIKGGVPEDYFTIDNMVSIERDGALDLLTSGKLKRKNNVFILDDVSVQWNSRASMTVINRMLNDILTISRVYRSIIICNLVARANSDLILRQLTDFVIRIQSKDVKSGRVLFKCYAVDVKADGKEYLKFLRWQDPKTGIKYRFKDWQGMKPAKKLMNAYQRIRQANTDEFIDTAIEKIKNHREGKTPKPDVAGLKIAKYKDQVVKLYSEGFNTSQVSRKLGITRWWVERCKTAADGGPV